MEQYQQHLRPARELFRPFESTAAVPPQSEESIPSSFSQRMNHTQGVSSKSELAENDGISTVVSWTSGEALRHVARDTVVLSMDLTPYPFETKTTQEILDLCQLEESLGDDWSLRFADELSTSDMSSNSEFGLDMDCDEDDGDNDEDPVDEDEDDDQERLDKENTTQEIDEPPEIKEKRNLLWRQSLKASLFRIGNERH